MKYTILENNQLIITCMCLAVFRIYLEVIRFDFRKLPLSSRLNSYQYRIHRTGLYLSIGYVILFAPGILLS